MHTVKWKYLQSPISPPSRLQSSCERIPETLVQNHGYHRTCYNRFTKPFRENTKSEYRWISTTSIFISCHLFSPFSMKSPKSEACLFFWKYCTFYKKVGRMTMKEGSRWNMQPTSLFEFTALCKQQASSSHATYSPHSPWKIWNQKPIFFLIILYIL